MYRPNYTRMIQRRKKTMVRKRKTTSYKRGTYKRYRKTYRRKPARSYLSAPRYRRAVTDKSAISHKIHSVKTVTTSSSCDALEYRIDEICPYKTTDWFWLKKGGAVIDQDIHTSKIFVRGGEWKLTMINMDEASASVEMYLAFCYDGSSYQDLEGNVSEQWHPHLSGKRFHETCKLSNFKRSFILDGQNTKKFTFKIGSFPIDIAEWPLKKKGWPFLYVVYNGANPENKIRMKYTVSRMITFTEGEDSRYGMSRDEINKLTAAMNLLKNQMGTDLPGVADTTMDHSADPST